MLDIETYKNISSGKLSSFLFIIPKKNHSFTAQYVAKDKQDAIRKLMQDFDIDYDESKGHLCLI
jgi:hypothetical protein